MAPNPYRVLEKTSPHLVDASLNDEELNEGDCMFQRQVDKFQCLVCLPQVVVMLGQVEVGP